MKKGSGAKSFHLRLSECDEQLLVGVMRRYDVDEAVRDDAAPGPPPPSPQCGHTDGMDLLQAAPPSLASVSTPPTPVLTRRLASSVVGLELSRDGDGDVTINGLVPGGAAQQVMHSW